MSSAVVKSELPSPRWETVKLSDVCQFKPPKSIPRKELSDESLVSFVPMNDLGELTKHFHTDAVRQFGEVVKGYTYFADGDVLCAKITPCFENGKLGIARGLKNGVGFGSSEFVVMRAREDLSPEFLYYYLSRTQFREAGQAVMSGAVGHKRVPKEYFEELEISLPPLDEQKRIVAVLDQAFAALDRASNLVNANLLDTSALHAATIETLFQSQSEDWEKGNVRKVIGTVHTGPFGSLLHKSDYIQGGIPLINPANIVDGEITPNLSKTVSYQAGERLAAYKLRTNDLIIGRRGEMGRCAPVKPEMDGWICGTGCFVIRPYHQVSSDFVALLLRRSDMVKRLTSIATGATMLNLNNKALSNMLVEVPKEDVQNQILARVAELQLKARQSTDHYLQHLSHLTQLRQSLLHRAFAGDLV